MKHQSSIEAQSGPSPRCGHIAHWTRMKHILLIAVCSSGLLAANPATAAEVPFAVSAPALFNQANAEQRAGRLGLAILNYERASLLAPGDPAIAQNLRAAQQKAGVSAPTVPMWQRPAHWLSFNELAGLASISLLMFSLLFFGMRFIPTTFKQLASSVASAFGISVVLAAAAVAMRWSELDRAVIVGAQAVAHIAPATNAAVSFDLKAGETVRMESLYGDFVRIRATDGRSGWVAASEVEKIIPAAS